MADNAPVAEDKPKHRAFNTFRFLRTERAQAVGAEVLNRMRHYEAHFKVRQRRRRPADQAKFERIVATVVADLMHGTLTVPAGRLAVPLSKRVLGKRSRYGSPLLSKTLPDILKTLASRELDFVELHKGSLSVFPGLPNTRTTMNAGAGLLRRMKETGVEVSDLALAKGQEPIVLKRRKKDRRDPGGIVDYKDNQATIHFRSQMERVNGWLATADISFEPTTDWNQPVDETDRFLQRYFNNGSFEQGGRLFGGFWQGLKKEARARYLVIDGEDVVTLDYGQMALRVLYGMAGATPPVGDAYRIPGLEYARTGVKTVFNSLLYTDKPLERFPQGTRKHFNQNMSVAQVVERLAEQHRAIAPYFCKAVGFHVMFIESEILVDVLLHLINEGVTALPVHDAIIVPESKAAMAKETMLSVFRAKTGVEGVVVED